MMNISCFFYVILHLLMVPAMGLSGNLCAHSELFGTGQRPTCSGLPNMSRVFTTTAQDELPDNWIEVAVISCGNERLGSVSTEEEAMSEEADRTDSLDKDIRKNLSTKLRHWFAGSVN